MEQELKISDTLAVYRDILKFLNESSDDYFFLLDISSGRVYFPDDMEEHYCLPRDDKGYCTLEDWFNIVYPKDLPDLLTCVHAMQCGDVSVHDKEYRVLNRAGEIVWIHCHGKVQLAPDGKTKCLLGRISDKVSQLKADRLTGAFSMDMMQDELDRILETQEDGYFLLVNVDDQKSINLKNGQTYGDQVLKWVAEAMEAASGGNQRIYRMNGDCFAVNLPGRDAQAVTGIFEQIRKRLKGKCTLSGGCVPFRTYKVPDAGTMFQYAETSVDHAKANGKDNLWFFSSDDYEKDLAVLELKEDLQKSVQDGFEGFSIFYQPQVHTRSYQLHGAEVLLRYQSPRRGSVSPVEFVPILEETKLICPVGMWVLESALEQCRKWRQSIPKFCVSVNMSYTQLCEEEDITDKVLDAVKFSGLPGSALTIEITEGMQLLNYSNLNEIFRVWKQFGITVSIDDFGTGYSNLGWLKEMEVDEIKIDRCFVSNIQHSAYNFRLLSNMIELADSSQIRVCCEGIETTEELAVLEELCPGLLQGFLFSRPCPVGQFEELYINSDSASYQERERREEAYRRSIRNHDLAPVAEWSEDEVVEAIMDAENDIFYVCDIETYELYYINQAGQRLLGLRDYRGKKCYKALQGRDEPCPFCTNRYLKPDDFYVWEQWNDYCGRHFVLKDKLITYRGKQVRLEVALDITKHEIVSHNLRERLDFANKTVEYTQALSANGDHAAAAAQAMTFLGEFYQADQICLFEPDENRSGTWSGTHTWSKSGETLKKNGLQRIPYTDLEWWLKQLRENRSVIIYDLTTLEHTEPDVWRTLNSQGISRAIAVPVLMNEKLVAFIGIGNPSCFAQDDAQGRVLAYLMYNRLLQQRDNQRYQELLGAQHQNIFNSLGVGLWIMRIDPAAQRYELLADETMYQVMGISEPLSPEACYQHWYTRINDGYYDYVDQAVDSMIQTQRVVQLEYTWRHPVMGEVIVQCAGCRKEDREGMICLEGYHRIISYTECPKPLEDGVERDIFEYNDLSKTIFFHTGRQLVAGTECCEAKFPHCWIEKEIVHPHFIEAFREVFSLVCQKSDLVLPGILIKGKSGNYEWFKLSMRHLGQEQQDLNTVVVSLELTRADRVQELASMRQDQFYHALLEETLAYAEVDLESGQVKRLGGLWQEYERDDQKGSLYFTSLMEERLARYLPEEELAEYRKCCVLEGWESILKETNPSRRFCYRRPVGNMLRWVELVIRFFRESVTQDIYALLYLKDINAEREQGIHQDEVAGQDPMTGVLNRVAFEQGVTDYVLHSGRGVCGMLMLLDVDNFRRINDNKGYLTGDRVLRNVARILSEEFCRDGMVGRLGGDEFLIFVRDEEDREQLSQRLGRLIDRLDGAAEFPVSSSLGAAFVHTEDFDYARSLKEADLALYQSKGDKKRKFRFFEERVSG